MTDSPGFKRKNYSLVNDFFIQCENCKRKCQKCETKYGPKTGNSVLKSHLEFKHKIKLTVSQDDEDKEDNSFEKSAKG